MLTLVIVPKKHGGFRVTVVRSDGVTTSASFCESLEEVANFFLQEAKRVE